MVYLYALVLVLQSGQSVVVQSNLDRTKCSTEIIALTGKNQQSELKVNEVGTMSFTAYLDNEGNLEYKNIEAPRYECHLMGYGLAN